MTQDKYDQIMKALERLEKAIIRAADNAEKRMTPPARPASDPIMDYYRQFGTVMSSEMEQYFREMMQPRLGMSDHAGVQRSHG